MLGAYEMGMVPEEPQGTSATSKSGAVLDRLSCAGRCTRTRWRRAARVGRRSHLIVGRRAGGAEAIGCVCVKWNTWVPALSGITEAVGGLAR